MPGADHDYVVVGHVVVDVEEATGARSPGVPLGYSQMVNPIYLARKGTMKYPTALAQMGRNFLANHAKALRPEPHIDRAGRVRGNWIGIWSILRGRVDPQGVSGLGRRR